MHETIIASSCKTTLWYCRSLTFYPLIEPLGNWVRIGTEGAWFATVDLITQTRGNGLLDLAARAFESPPSSRSTKLHTGLRASRNSKKKYPRVFRTTVTKQVFLLVD